MLYYGIRPVFVFDGGVPTLKRQTIRRRKQRQMGESQREQVLTGRIVQAKMKEHALRQLRTGADGLAVVNSMQPPKQKKRRVEPDDYALPPISKTTHIEGDDDESSEDEPEERVASAYFPLPESEDDDFHLEDIDTEVFKQLPTEIQVY